MGQSTKDLEEEAAREARESQQAEADLVAFFTALDPKSRAEYEQLATLDKEFGEDVLAEQQRKRSVKESGSSGSSGGSSGSNSGSSGSSGTGSGESGGGSSGSRHQ